MVGAGAPTRSYRQPLIDLPRPERGPFMRLGLSLALTVVIAMGLAAGSTSAAQSPATTPCTLGDATQSFESPLEHLIGSSCQYRLFWDGQTRTFCQNDFINGGIVWIVNYQVQGISRQDAIALIELTEDRVWIDGVEWPLRKTAYKDGLTSAGEHVVYQHRAFITQLPVGDHTSYWEDNVGDTATVTVRVLPDTAAACR